MLRLNLIIILFLALVSSAHGQWTQLLGPPGAGVSDIYFYNGTLFAISGGVWASMDHGETWLPQDSSGQLVFGKFYEYEGDLYVAGSALWRLDDTVWTELLDTPVVTMARQGSDLFTGNQYTYEDYIGNYSVLAGGAMRSTDNGITWLNLSLPSTGGYTYLINFFDDGTRLYALLGVATGVYPSGMNYGNYLAVSEDQGNNWISSNLYEKDYSYPCPWVEEDGIIYEGNTNGLWEFEDSVGTLVQMNGIGSVGFLRTAENGIVAGTQDSEYASIDLSLIQSSGNVRKLVSGDSLSNITGFAFDDNFAYVSTSQRSVWRTALSSLPLSGVLEQQRVISGLTVFPNPSQSRFTISFSLPEHSYISLKLYDELGILRSSIFDGEQDAGNHEIPLADQNLPNGMYEVVLRTAINRSIARLVIER